MHGGWTNWPLYKEVIICAGRNTIENSLPLPKLVEVNINATKKMNQYIKGNPNIKFHIITTMPLTKEPLHEPAREIFKNSITELESNANVTVSEMNEIQKEEIEGKHPNAAATIDIMAQLANIALGKERALFISSCNGCKNGLTHDEQNNRTGTCHKCLTTIPSEETMAYATSIIDKHNPPIQDGEQPAE